jgi:hypothetical protein
MKITFIKGVRRNRRITALKIQSNKYWKLFAWRLDIKLHRILYYCLAWRKVSLAYVWHTAIRQHVTARVVEALRYKPEGRGFESRPNNSTSCNCIIVVKQATNCVPVVITKKSTAFDRAHAVALQPGSSRVRFPMLLLEFFIDIILPAAIWRWGWLSL